MKQVFRTRRGFVVSLVPEPALPEDGVLVRVERSLISPGTETAPPARPPGMLGGLKGKATLVRSGLASLARSGIKKTWKATRAHMGRLEPTGYSCSGTVIARAPREGLPHVGERVACAGAGIANHAEVVAVPRNLLARVPESLSQDEAAYATVGAIALHAVHRAEGRLGESTVVFGLGLVGLLVLQIARASGQRMIAVDLDPARVDRARALGAEHALVLPRDAAPNEGQGLRDLVAQVREATGGAGADRVLLCHAGSSSEPTNAAIRMCRRRGRVVVVGAFGLEIEREPFYRNEVDLVISTSLGPGRYDPGYEEKGRDYPIEHVRWTEQRNMDEFLRLVATHAVDVRPLTDLVRPLEEAPDAFSAFSRAVPRPVGVLLRYDSPAQPATETALVTVAPRRRAIRVGIAGAGDFVRSVHLPILKAKGLEVVLVANRSGPSALAAALESGPLTRAVTDWRAVTGDPSVDLVLVGTRHDSHAEIAAAALDAGKHVFLEKPVATTRAGLDLVRRAHEKHGDRLLAVGHNRRFSSHALALEKRLRESPVPPTLVYLVNAPLVPLSSWIQDPDVGGGRILGEGTHFLDLLAFLQGEPAATKPELVSASALPSDGRAVPARDSYQALLRYPLGGLATLVYCGQGASGLPKERIEAHLPGASFFLDDFRSLEEQAPDGVRPLSRATPDKGYERLWEEVLHALRDEESRVPSPLSAFAAMETAFEIEERIRGLSPR